MGPGGQAEFRDDRGSVDSTAEKNRETKKNESAHCNNCSASIIPTQGHLAPSPLIPRLPPAFENEGDSSKFAFACDSAGKGVFQPRLETSSLMGKVLRVEANLER